MKFSELKKGMLLWRQWLHASDLLYIKQITRDRATMTEFSLHEHKYQVITKNVMPRQWWNEYRWIPFRLARYNDVKIFIRNIFKSI